MTESKKEVRVSRLWIGLGIALIVLLGLLLWSLSREPVVELQVKDTGELHALIPSIVGLTQSSLDQGNEIEVLQNGDQIFPRILSDMTGARETIHLEMFIWEESVIASRIAKVLADKARGGVEVRVLVDASGGRGLKGEVQEMLETAGAHVAHFHPFRISNLGRLNNRDHRKIVVIDGRIGYTGGFGIADTWTGNGQDKKHFRDTALRITGPVVSRLQSAFSENWIEETGEIPAGDLYFPRLAQTGGTAAHVVWTSPAGSISSVQILHYLAIKAARREILIQNPYMLPDRDALEALEEAVDRGVDVRIMVPSVDATDNAIVQHASHHHFGTMLKRGIRIWEYDRTLLHQKVMVIDGFWSTVGSTNFDDRSFQLNDEITIAVLQEGIASQLRSAFEADLRFAHERKLDEWKNRGLWHKFIDGIAYLGRSQL